MYKITGDLEESRRFLEEEKEYGTIKIEITDELVQEVADVAARGAESAVEHAEYGPYDAVRDHLLSLGW